MTGLRVLSGSRMQAELQMKAVFPTAAAAVLTGCRFPVLIDFRSFVLSLLSDCILLVAVMSFCSLRKTASSDEGGETLGSDSESEVSRNDI